MTAGGLRRAILLTVAAALVWGGPWALAGQASVAKRLRSKDAAERLEALEEILTTSRTDLVERARALREPLRRLATKDPSPEVRGRAAGALARADGERALDTLSGMLARERHPAAVALIPAAFAEAPVEPARRALAKVAFDVSDPRTAALAAESLGGLPAGAGLDDLLGLLEGARHWTIVAGTCLGLGSQRDARVPPTLLRRLRHSDPAVRSAARDALVRLCDVDHGVDPNDWEDWWAGVAEGYRFPGDEEAPAEPGPGEGPARKGTTSDDHSDRDRPTHAQFFGLPVRGRRVAFVVDFSQSMWGKRRDKAQKELTNAVKGLPRDSRFSVILFNEKIWWFKAGPRPATPQEKLDLELYLPEQETKSYTNIYDALEHALGLTGEGAEARDPAPGLDEVMLLSDGVPNRGKIKRVAQILLAVEAMNGGRVRINTVSLGDEPTELLPKLAEQNGGRYVALPFPK